MIETLLKPLDFSSHFCTSPPSQSSNIQSSNQRGVVVRACISIIHPTNTLGFVIRAASPNICRRGFRPRSVMMWKLLRGATSVCLHRERSQWPPEVRPICSSWHIRLLPVYRVGKSQRQRKEMGEKRGFDAPKEDICAGIDVTSNSKHQTAAFVIVICRASSSIQIVNVPFSITGFSIHGCSDRGWLLLTFHNPKLEKWFYGLCNLHLFDRKLSYWCTSFIYDFKSVLCSFGDFLHWEKRASMYFMAIQVNLQTGHDRTKLLNCSLKLALCVHKSAFW